MRRRWGLTRNFRRCGRQGSWKLFCDDHRLQPVGWLLFLVFTVVAGAASIYSAWFSNLWSNRRAQNCEPTNFHVLGYEVGPNRINKNQLIANIYIENDGGDAEIVAYSAWAIAVTGTDKDHAKAVQAVREAAEKSASEGGGLPFAVQAKEKRWFTDPGPVLSDQDMVKYTKGDYTFYFAGDVVVRRDVVKKSLRFCGFVIGNNPKAVLGCPASL